MLKTRKYLRVFTLMICLGLPAVVRATTITQTYGFVFSNFTWKLNGDGTVFSKPGYETMPAPVDTVSGSATVTFDPEKSYGVLFSFVTEGITLNSLSYPVDSPTVGFVYNLFIPKAMGIGSTSGLSYGRNNFQMQFVFNDDYSAVGSPYFAYSTETNLYYSNTGNVTVSTVAGSVPEPATMLLLGCGLLGLAGVRRKLS